MIFVVFLWNEVLKVRSLMTVIKVEKLSKKNKRQGEILRNISFEINDGECCLLIGPNWTRTLIDCLLATSS